MSPWKKALGLTLLSAIPIGGIVAEERNRTPTIRRYPNYLEPLFSSINQTNIKLDRRMARLRNDSSDLSYESSPSYRENPVHFASSWPHLLTTSTSLAQLNQEIEQKQEQQRRESYDQVRRLNIYFGGTGGLGDVFSKKDQAGFDYWTAGGLAGFDFICSKGGVGLLLDYDRIQGNVSHQWGKFEVDEAHASLYATYAPCQLAFNGVVGGGYEWYFIRRITKNKKGRKNAKGTPSGAEFDALFGMEYTVENDRQTFQFVPLASAQYIHLNVEKYREHNAGSKDMKIHSQTAKSLRSTLGARMNGTWEGDTVSFTPEVLLAWQREFLDEGRSVRFAPRKFAGPVSTLKMGKPGRNIALAGIDLLLTIYGVYGIEASYDFEWNSVYHDHNFYLGCNFRL
jgi:outer membrane autotransporter protein